MENIVQPNLKGTVFSWASLAGITFSHAAAGRPCRGRAAGALGSAGGAAQPSRRHRAREDVQWQPRGGSSGSAPRERLQHWAGSGRVRLEPACGCLHPSTQTDPKIGKILMGYFEWHSPGLYTVGGVMGTLSVFLDNLMSCCNEGCTEPLICMQFPHEMWILNSSKYESVPLTPIASLYLSIFTSSTAPDSPRSPLGSPSSLPPQ